MLDGGILSQVQQAGCAGCPSNSLDQPVPGMEEYGHSCDGATEGPQNMIIRNNRSAGKYDLPSENTVMERIYFVWVWRDLRDATYSDLMYSETDMEYVCWLLLAEVFGGAPAR